MKSLLALAAFGCAVAAAADLPPPSWPAPAHAPPGAPTVVLVMTDDVGFGASSTFGGPVGSDEGTPVTEDYASPARFSGELHELTIDFPATAN